MIDYWLVLSADFNSISTISWRV